MIGVRRGKISYHRIQDEKAIISLTLYRGDLSEGGTLLTWVGDGYVLLAELQEAIQTLERKHARKKGLTE